MLGLVLWCILWVGNAGDQFFCPQPGGLDAWGLCVEEEDRSRIPPCYCDDRCPRYGDCCRDARPGNAGVSPYRCIKVSPENQLVTVSTMMVAACPPQIPDELCEGSGLPLQDLPVITTSGQVYRNVFCAKCHGQNPPPFKTRVQCQGNVLRTDLENAEYNAQMRQWIFPEGRCWLDTTYILKKHLRRCIMTEDQCDASSKHARNCGAFLATVFHLNTSKAYRNYYCALCAGIPEDELDCYFQANQHWRTTSFELYSSYFDISILVDFNPPERQVKCSFWDPIQMRCLNSTNNCENGIVRRTFVLRKDGRAQVEGEIVEKSDFILQANATELVDCRPRTSWQIALRLWLTWICVPLSIGALCIHLVVYCALPSLRTFPGRAVMSLSSSLLVAHSLLLLAGPAASLPSVCRVAAAAMHMAYLAALSWMTVLAWDLWDSIRATRALRSEAERGRRFLFCSLCAWGMSLGLVVAAGALEVLSPANSFAPGYGRGGRCWLVHGPALLLWFVAPLAISMSANVIFFVLTAMALHRSERPAVPGRPGRLGVAVRLSAVLGLPWVFGLLAPELPVLWPLFIVLTGLQGVFVFLAFTFKTRVWRQLRARVRKPPIISYSSNTNLTALQITSSSSKN